MKKSIWKLIPALLLALLILGGCAAKEVPTEPEDDTTTQQQEPVEETPIETEPDAENPETLPTPNPADTITWTEPDLCAISYLGFANESLGDEAFVRSLVQYAKDYDLLADIESADVLELPGYEVYFLVPRDADTTITVYDRIMDEETGKDSIGDKLYESTGAPLLLLCNLSDLFSNCSITVTAANGETTTFSPSISLEHGGLTLPDSGVQNVTPDIDFSEAVG